MKGQRIGPDDHLEIYLRLFVDRYALQVTRDGVLLYWLGTALHIIVFLEQFNLVQSYNILNQLFVVFFYLVFRVLATLDAEFSDLPGSHNVVVNFSSEVFDQVRAVMEILLELHDAVVVLNV